MIKPLLICVFFFCFSLAQAQKKRVVFFGDSITELAVKPNGFIHLLSQKIKENSIAGYEMIGAGVSSDKVYDLYLRLEEDVLKQKPDVVVIWIGVNDVWHKPLLGTGTDADKFERFYAAIIKKLKDNGIAVYLCTPAVIGEKTDVTNVSDGDLNKYSAIIRTLAQRTDCHLIDFRKHFLAYNLKYNTANKEAGILTYDKVHLNDDGNKLVAEEMYKALIKQ